MAERPTKRVKVQAKGLSISPRYEKHEAPTQRAFPESVPPHHAADPHVATERSMTVAAQAVTDRATLTVLTGLDAGQVHMLDHAETIIGRGLDAHVILEDSAISRKHARVERHGKRYTVVDLQSTNGTYVRGRAIEQSPVSSGDRIQLGPNVVLRFALTDETEESLQRRLYESSTRDTLTRTFNRKYFRERLLSEIAFASRHKTQVAVLMIDVDHFKRLNDAHGHLAGDEVLKTVANVLHAQVRREDILARFGGEEFAVLARAGSQLEVERLAERLRTAVEKVRVKVGKQAISTTVSIGVARLSECPPSSTDADLISLADSRLYRAKAKGRNAVCVSD